MDEDTPDCIVIPEPDVLVRRARTGDVRGIVRLVETYAPERRLLAARAVTLNEDIQEFRVAERAGEVVGCGALHVFWHGLAEIRTAAVDPPLSPRKMARRI